MTEARVDPYYLDRWGYDTDVRQQTILYCLTSPGKTAWVQARNLWLFLARNPGDTPFDKIKRLLAGRQVRFDLPQRSNDTVAPLAAELRRCGFGDYTALAGAFAWTAQHIDVNDESQLTVANMCRIPRCFAKTARLIITNLVPEAKRAPEDRRLAILDVHILRWIRSQGFNDCPEQAPQSDRKYRHWESIWLELLDRGIARADLDQWRDLSRTPPADWRSRPISRKTGGKEKPQWTAWDGTVLRKKGGSYLHGRRPFEPSSPPPPEDGGPNPYGA